MSEKYLNKDGLVYTLQKLKPMIDSKANKSDVYTKEEYDERIRNSTMTKIYTKSIGDVVPTYMRLGTISFTNSCKFVGKFMTNYPRVINFLILKLSNYDDDTLPTGTDKSVFYMQNRNVLRRNGDVNSQLLITPKSYDEVILWFKPDATPSLLHIETNNSDMLDFYTEKYMEDTTYADIIGSAEYKKDIKTRIIDYSPSNTSDYRKDAIWS